MRHNIEMLRDGIYAIEDVFKLLESSEEYNITVDGRLVNRVSARYKCFRKSGTVCAKCGLEGTYFALERQVLNTPENRYHFNLYALDSEGREVMMCKHKKTVILPKGQKQIRYETLCEHCLTNLD